MTARLACTALAGGWGSLTAFRHVDLAIEPGCVHAVLGPNGAGKTTLLLTLAGLLPTHAGEIALDGVVLKSGQATAISKAGIVLVPDNRELFTTLTVEENLRVAAGRRGPDPRSMLEMFPALEPRWSLRAGALSGGEQQMLAIGRALMARPKLLLLDEPSMGLAPIFVERIFETIVEVNKQGTSILLVEQNALMALDTADRGYVMETGSIALADDAKALRENEQVRKTYLGED